MWIVRDKNGPLILSYEFPKRHIDVDTWERRVKSMVLYDSDFPMFRDVKWEDEPLKVDLMLTESGMSQKYDELKDAYEALHMMYLSQVSLYKSLYEEEKKKDKS